MKQTDPIVGEATDEVLFGSNRMWNPPMAMPLQHLVDDIVEPNRQALDEDPSSIAKGFNYVAALDSFAAHIWVEATELGSNPYEVLGLPVPKRLDDTSFRHTLADLSEDFRLIRDTAKANKHAILTQGMPRVNGSGDTKAHQYGYGIGVFGEGRFAGGPQLIVTELDGREHFLEGVASRAREFLDQTARNMGLLE